MFSIIIATRDRPELLRRALQSVAGQSFRDYELLLVDDSASAALRARNAALIGELVPAGVVLDTQTSAEGGSGPGAARNRGLARASRPYLVFLDDDDEWIDPEYLERARGVLDRFGLDLLFADQVAVRADGSVVDRPVWSEDLAEKLPLAGVRASDGVFLLTAAQVLLSDGFAHLNTTIVRRDLAWDQLGGFDPVVRYEEDRDFYLRAIDRAQSIGYMPGDVARHYVPESRASASSIATEKKEAGRLIVLSKAAEGARHDAVRARGRRDRSFVLKKMTARAVAAGSYGAAIEHGRAALRDRFSVKWAVFVAGLYVRRAFSRRAHAE